MGRAEGAIQITHDGGGHGPPPVRAGEIPRRRLLDDLASGRDLAVLSVVAPAGSGKSLFAAQWCRSDKRSAGWIGVREADNDPVVLLGRVVAAVESVEPLDPDLLAGLGGPAGRLDVGLARFVDSLGRRAPIVLVLDDVHLLHGQGALDVIHALVDAFGGGSQLVVVSRSDPAIGLARRRVTGEVCEVRAADLALDEDETAQLVTAAGLVADGDDIAELWRRTEGWASGVAFATMASARAPGGRLEEMSGAHRHLAEYFAEEVLGRQSDDVRRFLVETSVMDRLSGPVCDEVTGRRDSARVLRALAGASLFVVPLDDGREWYRYHHLFQDLLRAELAERPADDSIELLRRAAAWHEHHGDPAEAFDYARQGGDMDRAGRVLLGTWDTYAGQGRIETLMLWLHRCGEQNIESDPQLALGAAFVAILVGEVERANRYLVAAQRHDLDRPSPDGTTSLHAIMLTLRANLAPDGIAQVLEDALAVVASEGPKRTRWLSSGYRNAGVAYLALGRPRDAADALREVVRLTDGQPQVRHVHLAGLGLLAIAHLDLGDVAEADRLTREAEEQMAGVENTMQAVPVVTARAGLAAAVGDLDAASVALRQLHGALPLLIASPCVQSEMALRGAIAARMIGDTTSARALLGEARLAAALLGDAGTLLERIDQAAAETSDLDPRLALLSPAEARVLRQLATHLTLKEIAERLFVSRSTVKTQVAAVYAKLGVSSRAEAVAIAGSGSVQADGTGALARPQP